MIKEKKTFADIYSQQREKIPVRRKKENGCRFNLRRERSDLHPLIKMHNALRAHRFRVHYVFSEEIETYITPFDLPTFLYIPTVVQ